MPYPFIQLYHLMLCSNKMHPGNYSLLLLPMQIPIAHWHYLCQWQYSFHHFLDNLLHTYHLKMWQSTQHLHFPYQQHRPYSHWPYSTQERSLHMPEGTWQMAWVGAVFSSTTGQFPPPIISVPVLTTNDTPPDLAATMASVARTLDTTIHSINHLLLGLHQVMESLTAIQRHILVPLVNKPIPDHKATFCLFLQMFPSSSHLYHTWSLHSLIVSWH